MINIILDAYSTAAEKATYFFNEVWFIKLLEKFWFTPILLPQFIGAVRRWEKRLLKKLYYEFNELFCKLPFMRSIKELQHNRTEDLALRQKMHSENTEMLKRMNDTLMEIGRSQKRSSIAQRDIQDSLNITKFDLNEEFDLTDCTNAFLKNIVEKDKSEMYGTGYMNSVYYEDRKYFKEQLEIAKNDGRENDFEVRFMPHSSAFIKYHVKVKPVFCLKEIFIGCSVTLTKI